MLTQIHRHYELTEGRAEGRDLRSRSILISTCLYDLALLFPIVFAAISLMAAICEKLLSNFEGYQLIK